MKRTILFGASLAGVLCAAGIICFRNSEAARIENSVEVYTQAGNEERHWTLVDLRQPEEEIRRQLSDAIAPAFTHVSDPIAAGDGGFFGWRKVSDTTSEMLKRRRLPSNVRQFTSKRTFSQDFRWAFVPNDGDFPYRLGTRDSTGLLSSGPRAGSFATMQFMATDSMYKTMHEVEPFFNSSR